MRNYVLACVLICLFVGNQAQAEVRTWRARKGNFSAEAELVDVQNGKVVLKKKDDTTVTVPLDQLSLADVKYVDEYLRKATEAIGKPGGKKKAAKSPGKKSSKNNEDKQTEEPATEDPGEMESFAEGEEPSEDSDKAADPEKPSDEEDAPEADETTDPEEASPEEGAAKDNTTLGKKKRREPPLTRPNSSAWQVRIEVDSELKWRDLSINLPDHSESQDLLLPSTPSPFVAINGRVSDTGIHVWDLRNKQLVGPMKSEDLDYGRPAALSPDGDLVAITPSNDPVQIWSLRKKIKLNEIKLGGKGDEPYVQFATFAGPDRLVVSIGYKGGLVVVNPRTGAEIATFEAKSSGSIDRKSFAVSPCGTYIAVAPSYAPVRVFDTRNGALAGELLRSENYESKSCECLTFSSDGRELAALLSGDVIACWSMKSGRPVENHEVKDLGSLFDRDSYTKLDFIPGKKGWILGGKVMVDRPKGRIVWQSKEVGNNAPFFVRVLDNERMLAMIGSAKDCRLATQRLPWQEVEKATELVEKGGAASDVGMPPVTVAKNGGRKVRLPGEPRKSTL